MATNFTRKKLAAVAEFEASKNQAGDKFKWAFHNLFGMGTWPWCAAFTRWCCENVGLNIPLMCNSSFGFSFGLVEGWQQWAIEKGFYLDNTRTFLPEPGDIVIFDWSQRDVDEPDNNWDSHIGVFIRMTGGVFICAEGNVNNQTALKYRQRVNIQGYVRIPDGYDFTVPDTAKLVKGLDVSAWNAFTDWTKVKALGFEFAFIKATEGLNYANRLFAQDWAKTRELGITRGAYHFFRAGLDPKAQARFFLNTLSSVGGLKAGDLFPVIDWEVHGPDEVRDAQIFLLALEAQFGVRPFIYTYPSYINEIGNPDWLKDYPLWIANFGVALPQVPKPFPFYVIWQTGNTGLEGMQGKYDQNVVNPKVDLKKYLFKG